MALYSALGRTIIAITYGITVDDPTSEVSDLNQMLDRRGSIGKSTL